MTSPNEASDVLVADESTDTTTTRPDDPTRRRVTIELWGILALPALAFPVRWIDATTPPMLPALQALPTALPRWRQASGLLAAVSRRWRVAIADGDVLVAAAHPVPLRPGDTELWHAELAALATWAADVPRNDAARRRR